MIRVESLQESQPGVLALTDRQARALAAAGKRLVSRKTWWGDSGLPDGESEASATVIRVEPYGAGQWSVRVNDAIGVIALDDLELIVSPKIPLSHLLHLFAKSGQFPRLEEENQGLLDGSPDLWSLVAAWFITSAERLLRQELMRDYEDMFDELATVRGRLEPAPTASLYYSGRLAVACEFDEFSFDTPLNGVLRAAAAVVAKSPLLDGKLNRRAIRTLARMTDVGSLRAGDLVVHVDRRTGGYREPLALAHQVISGSGRDVSEGAEAAWTFLIRTPEMVEEGIRNILAERLPGVLVTKEARTASGSKMTFNPDLVFNHGALVGDVKYKLAGGDWSRGDLYQAIAFAEAFRTRRACVVQFGRSDQAELPEVEVGLKRISPLRWLVDALSPELAAAGLAQATAEWLAP